MNVPIFQPHPFFKSGNAQTVAAVWWPQTRFFPKNIKKTHRVKVDEDNTLLVNSNIQPQNAKNCDDILLVHGFEGSSVSKYMVRMAKKSLLRGYNVHRMNLRSCGKSMFCCATPYHAGLWQDVLQVAKEVCVGKRLFIVGYSLGGNLVLKMAGDLGKEVPKHITAISSVSAPMNLATTLDWLLDKKLYHKKFLNYIVTNYRRKKRLHPKTYPEMNPLPDSLRDFDERIICQMYGFKDADEYYRKSSCGRVLENISVPTFVIYSEDDPIIPAQNYHAYFTNKEYKNIELLGSKQGGHVAFIGDGKVLEDSDRFWADERIFDFFSRFSEV